MLSEFLFLAELLMVWRVVAFVAAIGVARAVVADVCTYIYIYAGSTFCLFILTCLLVTTPRSNPAATRLTVHRWLYYFFGKIDFSK